MCSGGSSGRACTLMYAHVSDSSSEHLRSWAQRRWRHSDAFPASGVLNLYRPLEHVCSEWDRSIEPKSFIVIVASPLVFRRNRRILLNSTAALIIHSQLVSRQVADQIERGEVIRQRAIGPLTWNDALMDRRLGEFAPLALAGADS